MTETTQSSSEVIFQPEPVKWSDIINRGLITGVILLFVGMVGMLAAFNEREIVRDYLTLGQLLIIVVPFIGAFISTRKTLTDTKNAGSAIASGLLVGVLTALMSLALLWLTNLLPDIDDILTNVNRDWIETITFDNRRDQPLGAGIFFGVVMVSSVVGTLLYFIPEKIRKAIIWGTSFTVAIAIFGETVNLILDQLVPDAVIDALFRRDSLLLIPAIGLFVLSNIGALIWVFVRGDESEKPKRNDGERSPAYYIGMALFVGLLLALPWIVGRTLSDVAVTVGLFVLMGFGLNIAIGLAGLLDLGYVTNYAVGAYVLAVLTSTGLLGRGPEWLNFWMVIPIALISAMIAGFLFAVPVLKMRGDYLAIATLGFGEIIGKLALSDWLAPIIGGAQGVLRIPKP
ncbi:MAG: hypothetical protein AAFV93_15510, partial [Chloroflexota bacterium]